MSSLAGQIGGGAAGRIRAFGPASAFGLKTWHVDANLGSDDNVGDSAETPLLTIATAIDRAGNGAKGGKGDVIVCEFGSYAETVTVPDGMDYLTIVGGSPSGYGKPDIGAATGSALVVNAQGFVARHLRLFSTESDVVQQHGNGFLYEDCVIDGDTGQAATEANIRLLGAASGTLSGGLSASEGLIKDCYIRNSNGYGIVFQHKLAAAGGEGVTDVEVTGCRFVGNAVSDIASRVNTNGGGAGIYINASIHNNRFLTLSAGYVYLNLGAGVAGDLAANSGMISSNFFADETVVAGQILIAGQPLVAAVGNYDTQGLIVAAAFNN